MARADADRIADISSAIEEVRGFARGHTAASFVHVDAKTLRAVSFSLCLIGEAVKGLSDAVKSRHTDVDWIGLAGLRDVLIHQYFRADPKLIWAAVVDDLVRLADAVERERGFVRAPSKKRKRGDS
ncbi:MAG: DUF86 domain-containing protein [Proteobacteria bacterium]|nr:DUF86 domain-containing protein [Pseudomonadota bacterium]